MGQALLSDDPGLAAKAFSSLRAASSVLLRARQHMRTNCVKLDEVLGDKHMHIVTGYGAIVPLVPLVAASGHVVWLPLLICVALR